MVMLINLEKNIYMFYKDSFDKYLISFEFFEWIDRHTSSKTSTRALFARRTLTVARWPCSLAISRADAPF